MIEEISASLKNSSSVVSVRFAEPYPAFRPVAEEAFPPLLIEMQRNGRAYSTADAQIAAIALVHGATVATRNTNDFELAGIDHQSVGNPD